MALSPALQLKRLFEPFSELLLILRPVILFTSRDKYPQTTLAKNDKAADQGPATIFAAILKKNTAHQKKLREDIMPFHEDGVIVAGQQPVRKSDIVRPVSFGPFSNAVAELGSYRVLLNQSRS